MNVCVVLAHGTSAIFELAGNAIDAPSLLVQSFLGLLHRNLAVTVCVDVVR